MSGATTPLVSTTSHLTLPRPATDRPLPIPSMYDGQLRGEGGEMKSLRSSVMLMDAPLSITSEGRLKVPVLCKFESKERNEVACDSESNAVSKISSVCILIGLTGSFASANERKG